MSRRSVKLDEVMRQPIIAFVRAGYPDYHRWLEGVVHHAKLKARIVTHDDEDMSLMATVEAGMGIACGPSTYATMAGRRAR